jgi:hypothetical protein
VTCAIVHLTRQAVAGTPGRLLRVLDRKWAVRLGEFSYSLYLVHYPVINLFDLFFRHHFGPATVCVLAYGVSLPVAVGLSYLFHLAFERPFMSVIQKQQVPAVESGTMPGLSNPALDGSPTREPAGADSRPVDPTVSVVIPNHDSAGYLPRAIRSVLGQTYRNVEVIIVDDVSSEDPAPALTEFGDRVRLIRHQTNGGPSVARNTGAAAAGGTVLAFLDADDWWPLDFLQRVVPLVGPGVCACYDSYSVEEAALAHGEYDGRISGRTLCHDWLLSGPPSVDRGNMQSLLTKPSLFKMVVHRSDHEAVGGFDPRYREGEDLHFCLKLVAAGRRLMVVEQPKGFYLVRAGSILRTAESDPARQTQSLRGWWGMFRDLPREQPLPSPVESECDRLSGYYRARYADAALRQHLRGRRFLTLLKPAILKAAVPAVPGIIRLKADGLARRVRSLSRRVTIRRSESADGDA